MKLLDVCDFIIDCPHSTAKDEGKGYPLIRTPNIGRGRLKLEDVHRVSERVYNERNARGIPQDNDLIFAREAPAGNVAVIKNGEKVCLGQRTVLIRPNPELVDSDYLAYYLLSPQQQYKLLGTANGATVAHVNLPVIRNLEIELPEIDVQHKLAAILTSYDSLIENNQKQIKLLEEAAQRLYKEWFVDLRFPDYETTPVVDGVPEGWRKKKLAEVCSIIKRGISPTYDEKGQYRVINQKCIRQSIMDIRESRRESKKYADDLNLIDCDTVICSTGTGTLGRVGQVFGDYDNTTFDSHVTLVRSTYFPNFIYQTVKYNEEYLMGMGRGSTNQQELYRGVIEDVDVILPYEDLLVDIERKLRAYHDAIVKTHQQIILSQEARDRLLPKLMSGEIDI